MQMKATQQEEEYFARLEFERRRDVLTEREPEAAEEDRQRILAVARLDSGKLDQGTEDTGFLGGVFFT